MGAHVRRLLALGLAALLPLAGCRSGSNWEPMPGSDYVLGAGALQEANAARALQTRGELGTALVRVRTLAARFPTNIALAVWQQDLELAGGVDPAELMATARERLEIRETVPRLLLVARLETDPERARALLERAAAIAPSDPWTRYALAHLDARAGRWGDAQEGVGRALDRDAGHLAARRLEASLFARDGKRDSAIEALQRWLAVCEESPLVDPAERLAAQLDLALLLVLDGRSESARDLLRGLADEPLAGPDAARRLCILAGAEQAEGRPDRALAAAEAAERADTTARLAVVQQALLHEELDEPDAARAAWERVLSAVEGKSDLGNLIQSMRAQVVLERSGPAAPGPEGAIEGAPRDVP